MVLSASKKNEMLTDLAAVYGVGDLTKLAKKRYDLVFSLWLNLQRSTIRKSEIVRLGTVAAYSGGQNLAWFAAISDSIEEAKHRKSQHQIALNREKMGMQ